MQFGVMRSDDGLSSGFDKALFFVVFLVGAGVIVGLKVFQAPGWMPIAAGIASIAAYCGLAWASPRLRLREDRIGDGAYYLGFLLTLVSLAYALWQFSDSSGGVEGVITGFGLALATTIVGLAMRVAFQQLREDPEEFEREARVVLSNAVANLEREVRLSVENLVVLRDRTSLELNEVVGVGMQKMLRENQAALSEITTAFRAGLDDALGGVRQSVEAMNLHAAETKKGTTRLLNAVMRLAERIEETKPPTDVLLPKVAAAGDALERLAAVEAKRIATQQKAADEIATIYQRMGESARGSAAVVALAKQAALDLEGAIKAVSGAATDVITNVRNVSASLATGAQGHTQAIEVALKAAQQSEAEMALLRSRIAVHVDESAAGLTALQRQVVDAASTIVRELNREGGQ